jgi:tRNA nucleotidyltransferase/poly(A) polymerase
VLRWSLLLHDVAKPDTFARLPGNGKPTFHGHELLGADRADAVLRRLRLPRHSRRRVVRLVRLHLRPGHLADCGASPRAVRRLVVAAGEDLPLLVLHAACDAAGSGASDPPRWRRLRAVCAALLAEAARERRRPPPLVSGADVMRVCAIEPGPRVGRLLALARELQRDGVLASREDALAWLHEQRGTPPA